MIPAPFAFLARYRWLVDLGPPFVIGMLFIAIVVLLVSLTPRPLPNACAEAIERISVRAHQRAERECLVTPDDECPALIEADKRIDELLRQPVCRGEK